jgi:GlcNAc-P-P-Und epimerase
MTDLQWGVTKELATVAVTGGTGCLGRPLIQKLLQHGYAVRLLVIPKEPDLTLFSHNRLHVVSGRLNEYDTLRVLTEGCDVIFHLAGKVHFVPKTDADTRELFSVNVEGTRQLVRAATVNHVRRIIFYSTVGVYGYDADFHGDELMECHPVSAYAVSKYQAEQLILESPRTNGPDGVVLRFPVAYGPYDNGNIARLIRAIHHKRFVYLGDGNALRSMISSVNAAEAAYKAAFIPGEVGGIFCITDDRDYSVNELVTTIRQALQMTWSPWHLPQFVADLAGKFGDLCHNALHLPVPLTSATVRKLSRPLVFSCEKAKTQLGYIPVESLYEGILNEINWLTSEPD